MLISSEQISRFTTGPPKVLAPKLSPQWSEKKEHRPQVMQDIDNCLRIPTVPASAANDPPIWDLVGIRWNKFLQEWVPVSISGQKII